MQNRKLFWVVPVLLLFLASCRKNSNDNPPNPPDPPEIPADNDHLLLGNPTNAKPVATEPYNYLKDYTYYKISYNKNRGIPTWVAWHLQSEDKGSTPRQDDFRPDTQLPSGWFQVQSNTYSGSGFDRGHNCPSADRTSSVPANSSTFFMTNMIPQAPNFNQGPWAGLEDFVRDNLVGTNNEAYILMGNYGNGGYGSNGEASSIANGNVSVPRKVWKVVLVIPKSNNDLSRISSNSTVLVVDMPNDNRLYSTSGAGRDAWINYSTTIDRLEDSSALYGTPLNLFTNIPENIRGALKTKQY